ncbi:hypothetical protein QYF61_022621 [Mycteria americana]|uniref:Uncharacterized protein n=1 Tax=Mycteria americana TaxID=33587 RepID=A0AAN7S731_MYCAM|nr:hypothetical protein QYF61_022621 [Mycteria americana]
MIARYVSLLFPKKRTRRLPEASRKVKTPDFRCKRQPSKAAYTRRFASPGERENTGARRCYGVEGSGAILIHAIIKALSKIGEAMASIPYVNWIWRL